MYVRTLTPALLCVCAPAAFGGTWINFFDETADRVVCESTLFADDDQEKDYAWGDVDRDGDIDLVIVRKEPFTSSGRYPNVLLLNEGGVLVDYTDQYAVAADVAGDEGFLTPTNDRDVILVDRGSDGDDPDRIRVSLAEDRPDPGDRHRLVQGDIGRINRLAVGDGIPHPCLDGKQFVRRAGLAMGEIEAEPVVCDQ